MSELLRPGPVTLDAPPLILRPWHHDDAPALLEAIQESVESVGRWLPWCNTGYDMDEALKKIASCIEAWDKGEYFSFAVLDTLGRLLGDIRLNRIDEDDLSANLGYWLRSSATGNGYAALAGRAVIAFGFQAVALKRIELVVAVSNLASQRCAERIGAQREGIARQRIFLHGQSEDAVVYGLIPSDLA